MRKITFAMFWLMASNELSQTPPKESDTLQAAENLTGAGK